MKDVLIYIGFVMIVGGCATGLLIETRSRAPGLFGALVAAAGMILILVTLKAGS